jgi:hypothetical protein
VLNSNHFVIFIFCLYFLFSFFFSFRHYIYDSTAKAERQAERDVANLFLAPVLFGRPKRRTAGIPLSYDEREDQKAEMAKIEAIRVFESTKRASSSMERTTVQLAHDAVQDINASSSNLSKKSKLIMKQSALSFSSHGVSSSSSLSISSLTSSSSSSSTTSASSSFASLSSFSSSSSSPSTFSYIEADLKEDNESMNVDAAVNADVEHNAAIEALEKLIEQEEEAEIDREIVAATDFKAKFDLATERHNQKVYKPFLEALLFGLGNRFPHEGVMKALDNVFNPVHWPLNQSEFLEKSYLEAEIALLADHFSLKCTDDNQSAVDKDELLLEVATAKVWLWESYSTLLANEIKNLKVPHYAASAPTDSLSKSTSKFTHPVLKSADAATYMTLEENLSLRVSPIVAVKMFEVVVAFLQVYNYFPVLLS